MATEAKWDEFRGALQHTVRLTDRHRNAVEATVIARAGEEPYLMLSAAGLMASLHMQPADADKLGRLLIAAGERASWAPVDLRVLEGC